jgi:hypothetical protein
MRDGESEANTRAVTGRVFRYNGRERARYGGGVLEALPGSRSNEEQLHI